MNDRTISSNEACWNLDDEDLIYEIGLLSDGDAAFDDCIKRGYIEEYIDEDFFSDIYCSFRIDHPSRIDHEEYSYGVSGFVSRYEEPYGEGYEVLYIWNGRFYD